MLDKIRSYFYKKDYTISEHLARHGFLTETELYVELAYCRRTVPRQIRKSYCVVIIPIVYLLKVWPNLNPVANKLARKIWIDAAIRKELDYVKKPNSDT